MFAWFQRLLPEQGDFFTMFEAHASTLVRASDAMASLLDGGADMPQHIQAIVDLEHEADDITRDVLQTVRRTFLTPFDRGSITDLIAVMDDAVDQMQQTAGAIDLYSVKEFDPEMKEMATKIREAALVAAAALPLLRQISRNGGKLHKLTERLVEIEGEVDEIHARGLRRRYEAHGVAEPMRFIVAREIYQHLERVADKLEDVANEIDGLVIDHA